jgi:hypothetical protein
VHEQFGAIGRKLALGNIGRVADDDVDSSLEAKTFKPEKEITRETMT